ncbi:MAG: hypothetical protein E6J79_00315 [Deltaproteobacteria bacterium]|nr:MAG: hypothetical protein E6J79_00315 [Deltaproteobacteria bacterium]
MSRRTILALAVAIGLGCARPAAPPPRDLPRQVAVLPPGNHTGDPLLVSGASFFERYALRTDRVTVSDALAAEARLQLERRGFVPLPPETVEAATQGRAPGSTESAVDIARNGGLEGLVLWIDVRRWEADAPTHPAFVIVGLAAELIDVSSGRVRWHAERRPAPVATPGEVNVGDAYLTAAHKDVVEVLAPLGPERPAER